MQRKPSGKTRNMQNHVPERRYEHLGNQNLKGKTIMLQHDVTSPRPLCRLHTISGTKGFAQKYPSPGIALEPDAHRFLPDKSVRLGPCAL